MWKVHLCTLLTTGASTLASRVSSCWLFQVPTITQLYRNRSSNGTDATISSGTYLADGLSFTVLRVLKKQNRHAPNAEHYRRSCPNCLRDGLVSTSRLPALSLAQAPDPAKHPEVFRYLSDIDAITAQIRVTSVEVHADTRHEFLNNFPYGHTPEILPVGADIDVTAPPSLDNPRNIPGRV